MPDTMALILALQDRLLALDEQDATAAPVCYPPTPPTTVHCTEGDLADSAKLSRTEVLRRLENSPPPNWRDLMRTRDRLAIARLRDCESALYHDAEVARQRSPSPPLTPAPLRPPPLPIIDHTGAHVAPPPAPRTLSGFVPPPPPVPPTRRPSPTHSCSCASPVPDEDWLLGPATPAHAPPGRSTAVDSDSLADAARLRREKALERDRPPLPPPWSPADEDLLLRPATSAHAPPGRSTAVDSDSLADAPPTRYACTPTHGASLPYATGAFDFCRRQPY